MQTVNVLVEKAEDKNYWASMQHPVDGWSVNGQGSTVRKAIDDFNQAYKEMKDLLTEKEKKVSELKFNFIMDIGSFFDYYPINVTAFAHYIGMNASLLRQYASGKRAPKEKAISKIRDGIQKFKNDINVGTLIERPILDYV